MLRLSVNLNKVALIRNARGGNLPNLRQFAIDCEEFGAQGITVHPRPDERHVTFADLPILKEVVQTEFNIEGNPTRKFLDKVIGVRPHQVTLVPDAPQALTSDAGWDTISRKNDLVEIIKELKGEGIRTSIFIDPIKERLDAAKETGTDRIEFYTGPFAKDFAKDPQEAIKVFSEASNYAHKIGLGINAGHDLNLENLQFFVAHMPYLKEVSIGHALISDALYYGIQNTIQMYRRQIDLGLQ
jgi:pyridoxine 5-phosphate synthase